jgi:hypothetical protein
MKFEYENGEEISEEKLVKVKSMNGIIEVTSLMNSVNGFKNILKINQDKYCLKDTGEIFLYNRSDNRSQNEDSLRQSFKKARELINNNFIPFAKNQLFITLTYGGEYAGKMTDEVKLYKDFKNFYGRLKRKYGKNIDYFSGVEPQRTGSWHPHVLLKHNELEKFYIPFKDLEKLWGNGFVWIRDISKVDNIGAYFSVYLTDIEIPEKDISLKNDDIKEVFIDGKKKSFIKGARLKYYPPGMNIFRHSKGIVYPEEKIMTHGTLKNEIVGSVKPNYSKTLKIVDENKGDFCVQKITYENYNMNKK